MKWKRDGDALISGDFKIVVSGETSTGRRTSWCLYHKGELVTASLRGKLYVRHFDKLSRAKNYAKTLAKEMSP